MHVYYFNYINHLNSIINDPSLIHLNYELSPVFSKH